MYILYDLIGAKVKDFVGQDGEWNINYLKQVLNTSDFLKVYQCCLLMLLE